MRDCVQSRARSEPRTQCSITQQRDQTRLKLVLIARLHQDGKSLVLKVGDATRHHLLQADSDTFFITDHYRGYPYVLAHLDRLTTTDLRKLLQRAIEASSRL